MNEQELTEQEIDRLRKYIEYVEWRFAKTYAKTAPHEYTIPSWQQKFRDEFEYFVEIIREKGYDGEYWNVAYRYFQYEGYKYWICFDTDDRVSIINREPIDLESWKKEIAKFETN